MPNINKPNISLQAFTSNTILEYSSTYFLYIQHKNTIILDVWGGGLFFMLVPYSLFYLIESSQKSWFLTGKSISFLDGGYGALQIARHHELSQLEHSMTQYKKLKHTKYDLYNFSKFNLLQLNRLENLIRG